MKHSYYVETTRWNDSEYQALVEKIYSGEKPQFIEENGKYTGYSLEKAPTSTDELWIVGSTRSAMLREGLIADTKVDDGWTATDEANFMR